MQRLRGSDAFAIYSETPSSPYETLKVAIYRPVAGIPDTGAIRDFVKTGIVGTGAARAKLRIVRVPLDLHHPVWVVTPGFSADNHIHEAELPPPGSKEQLCDFLSDLMSRPLRRDRPLWEVWVIRGLEQGRIAIAFKVHHALADGKSVALLVEQAHRFEHPPQMMSERNLPEEALPGRLRLIGGAMVDLAKSYTRELPLFYRHLKQARRRGSAIADATGLLVEPFSAPATLLNGADGGSDRLYRYESFSLEDFRALARHFDCTINTLVLGICSEALRRYLSELDALPTEPIIAVMPIGDQGGGDLEEMLDSDIHNNNLAVAAVPLYQNMADFAARLQAIKDASRAAINHVRHEDGRRFDNYLDFLPGTAIRLLHRAILRLYKSRRRPFANVVISNVPGPRETLQALNGQLEMEELLSVGNLADGGHLNITVWSYVDKLAFSFFMRKGALPQTEALMRHVREVEGELRAEHLPAVQRQAARPQG